MKSLHLNTQAEVIAWLENASEAVDAAALPDDLRVAAFTKAVDLLSNKQVQIEQSDFSPVALPHMAIPRGRLA